MNADIRVYPAKEMKAVDMAEIVDSVQLSNGILQGCAVEIIQNAVHIADGRILIRGRLGVVTAGNIENPTLENTATCYLAAVCDLAIENPFYISLLTGAELDTLDQKKSQVADFNVGDGVDYVILGTVQINPTTGVVSNWTPQNDSPVSNKLSFSPVVNDVTSLKTLMGNTVISTVARTITGAVNELLSKINSLTNRVTPLETKTAGIVRATSYDVASGATDYKQLVTGSTYILIINTAYPSGSMKGVYLVGIAGTNVIGIKTVNNATDVVVSDAGNKLLRVKNNGNAYLRCTLITTYTP